MSELVIQPARSLQGELRLPGDKSISHRVFLLGAMAHGKTRIVNALQSADVETTRSALQALGVSIDPEGDAWVVTGRPDRSLKAPANILDMGNSGTTTRLLLGILAGHPFPAALKGDASLSKRPMRRVVEPLRQMGAVIEGANDAEHLPLTVQGGKLKGIRYPLPVPSAQVKSALLLAGHYAEGPTTIIEPVPSRDHTERLLVELGGSLTKEGAAITLTPGSRLTGKDLKVPGDISSAAFFLVAAAIVPGSSVTAREVELNPTRIGFLQILRRMGAKVSMAPDPKAAWEPVGDVTVSCARLQAVTVEPQEIPALIDELPILLVAATQATGTSLFKGVAELKVKETDRVSSMVEGLSRMGAAIEARGDQVTIFGPCRLKGSRVKSYSDHRTAMSLAIAGLVAEGSTTVEESQWISISLPDFERLLEAIRR